MPNEAIIHQQAPVGILRLLAEADIRYRRLSTLLLRVHDGPDVVWHEIDLARADLSAVLDVIAPPDDDGYVEMSDSSTGVGSQQDTRLP